MIAGATWSDLDPREFARLRRLVSAAGRRADATLAALSDREIAEALGVVRPRPTDSASSGSAAQTAAAAELRPEALLLFGRPDAIRWFLPQHEAAIQVLRGDVVEANDFFHWPLFRLAEELLARCRARSTTRVIRYELVRLGVPDWSEAALRELLTNALIHRDYAVPGVVYVRCGDSGIAITNPVDPAATARPGAALTGVPQAPNALLVDAFRRAGIAGRTGGGIGRAVADQLRLGLAAPRFDHPDARSVVAELPAQPADLAFARFVVARERLGHPLDRADLQLLTAVLHRAPLRTADAAALLTTDRGRARAKLFGLLCAGLVTVHSDASGRTWHPTAKLRSDLHDSATHVRAQLAPARPDGGRSGTGVQQAAEAGQGS
ncbi:hypothetical protein ND747_12265 [Frankia sp. R82]|nr:hypothetical protein [Frankia sp. R82]